MNYLEKKDKALKRFTKVFEDNFKVLNEKGFVIKWSGIGGRDDDYFQVDIQNHNSKIELNILVWINLHKSLDDDSILISYSCYKRADKNEVNYIFKNEVFLRDLSGFNLDDKITSLLNKISNKL
jgi:hypothetical protein